MTGTLVEPLTASPMRSLLRHRFSSRVDRALVFLSAEGEDRVAHPHGPSACPYPPPSLGMVRRKAFAQVYWVSLAEHDAVVDRPDRTRDGWQQPSVRRTVTWQVSDPAIAARQRLSAQDAPAWIVYDLSKREHPGSGPGYAPGPADDSDRPPTDPWATGYQVREVGITYRLHPRAAAPSPDSSLGPVLPSAWDEDQRVAYRFYQEVIAQGPYGLAALWLLRQPDQVRDVLEWTVQNQRPLTEQASWEHSLVGLLKGLSKADRGFVGVKVAELLSGLGIPQADEALARVQGAGFPNPREYPGDYPGERQ